MDIVKIEQALTTYFAGKLGLTVDQTIFRGQIPAGRVGVAVRLGPETTGNDPETRKFIAQVVGRQATRDACLSLLEKGLAALPDYGVTAGGVTFKAILKQGSGGTFADPDGGQLKERFSFNAIVAC